MEEKTERTAKKQEVEQQEKETPLGVDSYLFRRSDVPDTLKAAFQASVEDPRSKYGPDAKRTRAEWAESLEAFRNSPPKF